MRGLHDLFLKPGLSKGELQLFLSQYRQTIVEERNESEHTANNDGRKLMRKLMRFKRSLV